MVEIQLGGGRVYRGETDERGRISGNGKAFDARGRLVYDGQWISVSPRYKCTMACRLRSCHSVHSFNVRSTTV